MIKDRDNVIEKLTRLKQQGSNQLPLCFQLAKFSTSYTFVQ